MIAPAGAALAPRVGREPAVRATVTGNHEPDDDFEGGEESRVVRDEEPTMRTTPERDDEPTIQVPPARGDDEVEEAMHVVVPHAELSADALRGVIVEYVTREGTEYGREDVELDTKIAQVRRQLERGEVAVVWDGKTETVNLVTRRQLRELGIG